MVLLGEVVERARGVWGRKQRALGQVLTRRGERDHGEVAREDVAERVAAAAVARKAAAAARRGKVRRGNEAAAAATPSQRNAGSTWRAGRERQRATGNVLELMLIFLLVDEVVRKCGGAQRPRLPGRVVPRRASLHFVVERPLLLLLLLPVLMVPSELAVRVDEM